MAKVAFLCPQVFVDGKLRVFLRDWTGADYGGPVLLPPIEQAQAAAFLRSLGHDVSLVDGAAEKLHPDTFISTIIAQRPDVVQISTGWESMAADLDILRGIRRRLPDVVTVVGGPLATAVPQSALGDEIVDYVALGDLEDPMRQIVEGSITHNVAFRDEDAEDGVNVLPRRLLDTLDDLPYPARDLIPNEKYWAPFLTYNPFTTLVTARGCSVPTCTFCPTGIHHQFKVKRRSPDHVLGEIEEIRHKFGIRQLLVRDETFTHDKRLVQGICEGILSKGLDVRMRVTTRPDLVDPEMLALMRRAGCDHISFGFETHNTETLARNKKPFSLEQHREAVALSKAAGMHVSGLFMIGMEGDTEEDARSILPYAKELGVDYAQFNVTLVVPGTVQHERLRNKLPKIGGRPDVFSVNSSLIPEERLHRIRREAILGFYLRPGFIARELRRVRSFPEAANLAKTALRLFSY